MVFERLKKLLVNAVDCAEDDINMDANLSDDLGIDSLDFVELSMEIEGEFNIIIADSDMAGIKTVGDIVKLVESKTA